MYKKSIYLYTSTSICIKNSIIYTLHFTINSKQFPPFIMGNFVPPIQRGTITDTYSFIMVDYNRWGIR